MADDAGDKTEAPTPRRRQEARDQGNIARSPDLATATLIVSAMILLKFYGFDLVTTLRNLMQHMLGSASFSDFTISGTSHQLTKDCLAIAIAAAPICLGMMVVGVIVNAMQVGVHFNTKRLQPNLAALNPVKGLGNLFGRKRGFVPILMNLVKLMVIGWFAYDSVSDRIGTIVSSQNLDFFSIFILAGGMVFSIAVRIGVILLILALVDYGYQWWKTEKELKMTKQQVKDEMKSMDGDPQMKSRRRQLAMDRLKKQIKANVPTADVVVTNPTHYAIALKYDAKTMHAPRVVAKGKGPIALQIREIAITHGIPILERKPLARALYRLVEVGQEIPEQFYSAVAEILAYVWELSGKLKRQTAAA